MNRVLTIIILAILSLSAFAPILPDIYAQKYGGTLVLAQIAEPHQLNPDIQFEDMHQQLVHNVFEQLLDMGSDSSTLIPHLAESWETSDDLLTYTYNLRRGVTWHDGHAFTAADVEYTFNKIINDNGVGAADMKVIDRIEVVDDYTIVMYMKEPNGIFNQQIASGSRIYSILPKHIYEGTDWRTNPYNEKPIGTGVYKFEEWVRGSHLSFVANEDHWRGRPPLDRIINRFMPDMSVAVLALEAGEVHKIGHPPNVREVFRLRDTGKFLYNIETTRTDIWHIAINTIITPFDNPKVRQALAYAIDRTDVTEKSFVGSTVAKHLYLEGHRYTNPDVMLPEYDPEVANQLLDEAGYPKGDNGVRFTAVLTTYAVPITVDLADVVKEQLSKVGIDIKIRALDVTTAIEVTQVKKDFELAVYAWYQGPDPFMLNSYFIPDGLNNVYSYDNPRVTELLLEATSTVDVEERKKLYFEAQEYLLQDMPRIPLFTQAQHQVYNPEFHGFWFEPAYQSLAGTYYNGYVWWEGGEEKLPPKPTTITATTTATSIATTTATTTATKVTTSATTVTATKTITETETEDITIYLSGIAIAVIIAIIGLAYGISRRRK